MLQCKRLSVILKLWNVVLRVRVTFSSVGGRGGVYTPPIGLSTKMQNEKNTTFLALLRRVFALEWTKKDLKHLLKHKFRGALICQKENPQINENFEKWPKPSNQI